ncbi:transcriptional regulator domain-containing protein, partial [Acetobacter sacchari]
MPISDWQSPAAYEHAKDIAAAGMAWEYLRVCLENRSDVIQALDV